MFTSKLIKSYFLSFLLFSHFALFVLSFSFFSFFCALALLVLSIFIAFSDYFLCYKQIYCICLVNLPFQCQCRLFLILGIYILKVVPFSYRDGPLEKLWGRGGGGIFEPQEFVFVTKFLV